MITISIANSKGGVGKTTIAANVAFELSRMGFLVLAIDLDPQGDLTKLLNPESQTGNILDVLMRAKKIADVCCEISDNLYLIPGGRENIQYSFKDCEGLLAECLCDDSLAQVDFVVIDHPPALSESALTGFVASDWVLVVTDAETFGVQNLGDLLQNIAGIQETMNPKLKILGIAANKVDLRRSLTSVILRELKGVFGSSVFTSQISYDTAMPTSARQRIPVRKLKWRSRTVNQIRELTQELLERMGIDNGIR